MAKVFPCSNSPSILMRAFYCFHFEMLNVFAGTEPTLGVGAANEVELFVILSPVGPYFAGGLKPVNLLADPRYVRAWQGGCGYVKMGSNYAPTLWTQVTKSIQTLVIKTLCYKVFI